MITQQIEKALIPFNCFVVSRDKLPKYSVTMETGYVINTDASDEPGEHWVAIYLDGMGRGEYFDSFGLPPLHDDFLTFLTRQCTSWSYANFTLQDFESTKCGEYCIHFLTSRFKHIDYFSILSSFSSNTKSNNKII